MQNFYNMVALSAATLLTGASNADWLTDFYNAFIRKPIFKLVFGIDTDLPWNSIAIDACLIWLSLFTVINVFIYRKERTFLWGHIRKNYCSRTAQDWSGSGLCTLRRWLTALATTPVACLRILMASLQSKQTLFTSSYMTIDPTEIGRYLKYLGLAIGAMLTLAVVVSRSL